MSRQIKLLGFIGFLAVLFVRTFVIYHPMAPLPASSVTSPFSLWFSSFYLGLGMGLFNAAATLVDMRFGTFLFFGIACGMLLWLKHRMGATSYALIHLATGFAMTVALLEALPNQHDVWYWGAFAVASILAPFSYFVLIGIFGIFFVRSSIQGLMDLFA